MSAEHTPGPVGMTQIPVTTLGRMHDHIARLGKSNSELMEALKLIGAFNDDTSASEKSAIARAAIAKATGSAA